MTNPVDRFAGLLPTADELAQLRAVYAETYPVRPLLNEIERLTARVAELEAERDEERGIADQAHSLVDSLREERVADLARAYDTGHHHCAMGVTEIPYEYRLGVEPSCDCPPNCQGPDNTSKICRAESGAPRGEAEAERAYERRQDGECFRGGEADAYLRDEMARVQRELK